MKADDFRRIALAMTDAIEGAHMSHPDFRAANGRVFASLTEDEKRATASLTPDQQADLLARAPETFTPAAGAWGRSGWTMIELKKGDAEIVGEAVTLAWQRISGLPGARRKAKAVRRTAVARPSNNRRTKR